MASSTFIIYNAHQGQIPSRLVNLCAVISTIVGLHAVSSILLLHSMRFILTNALSQFNNIGWRRDVDFILRCHSILLVQASPMGCQAPSIQCRCHHPVPPNLPACLHRIIPPQSILHQWLLNRCHIIITMLVHLHSHHPLGIIIHLHRLCHLIQYTFLRLLLLMPLLFRLWLRPPPPMRVVLGG